MGEVWQKTAPNRQHYYTSGRAWTGGISAPWSAGARANDRRRHRHYRRWLHARRSPQGQLVRFRQRRRAGKEHGRKSYNRLGGHRWQGRRQPQPVEAAVPDDEGDSPRSGRKFSGNGPAAEDAGARRTVPT